MNTRAIHASTHMRANVRSGQVSAPCALPGQLDQAPPAPAPHLQAPHTFEPSSDLLANVAAVRECRVGAPVQLQGGKLAEAKLRLQPPSSGRSHVGRDCAGVAQLRRPQTAAAASQHGMAPCACAAHGRGPDEPTSPNGHSRTQQPHNLCLQHETYYGICRAAEAQHHHQHHHQQARHAMRPPLPCPTCSAATSSSRKRARPSSRWL